MADGGEVLAPESPDVAQTQVVDAADLARWIVGSAAAGRTGTYNAVAPPVPLAECLAARPVLAPADIVWVPWEFLEAEGVAPWTDLPAWVPAPMAGCPGGRRIEGGRRRARSRPIEAVVRRPRRLGRGPAPRNRSGPGMTREREAELLRRFRAANWGGGPAARAMSQPRARSARG